MGEKSVFSLTNKKFLIFLIGTISLLFAAGGYWYYKYEAQMIREDKHQELKTIADLKIRQIAQWHKERIADVEVVSQGAFFSRGLSEWVANRKNRSLKEDIIRRLLPVKREFGYEEVFLASPKGDLLLSLDPKFTFLDKSTVSKIIESDKSRLITFTDFYFCPLHNEIHYDIISRISGENKNPIAVLIFRINPDNYLYPLIQTWPTSNRTAETLILRRDGDSVLFLNELRHMKKSALNLRIAMSETSVPAVQAILGRTGIFEGTDYRGKEVLAYIEPVPGTQWYMIAKIDRSEIFSDIYSRALAVFLFTGTLILLNGLGIGYLYRSRQRNIYRELYKKEKELWEHQKEYKTTLYSIGDGVITTDKSGAIQNMNPVAERLIGWNESEIRGKPVGEVFTIINEDTRAKVENPVERILQEGKIVGLANHTVLVSRDGKEIPITDSGAPIKNEEGDIIGTVLIFRDQIRERAVQKKLAEREENFRTITENANDGIIVSLKGGVHVFANRRASEITGYTSDELCSIGMKGLIHPEEFPQLADRLKRKFDGEAVQNQYETSIVSKQGKEIRVELTASDGTWQGKPAIVVILRDITERKRMENALRESEVLLKTQLDNSPDLIMVIDREYRYVSLNKVLFGAYKVEDLIGKDALMPLPESVRNIVKKKMDECFENKTMQVLDHEVGNGSWVTARLVPLPDGDEMNHIMIISTDITERKQLEERHRVIFDEAADGIVIYNAQDGLVADCNPEFTRITGRKFSELSRLKMWELRPPGMQEEAKNIFQNVISKGRIGPMESEYEQPDGNRIVVEYKSNLITVNGHSYIQSIARDITKRKRVEKALQEREKELSEAQALSHLGSWKVVFNENGEEIWTGSPELYNIYGYPPGMTISGQTGFDRMHPDDREVMKKNWTDFKNGKAISEWEHRIVVNGETKWIHVLARRFNDASGRIISAEGTNQDVTELRLIHQEMIQMQKMQSIGTLAGGIAHDFNNLLGILLSHVLLISKIKDDNEKLITTTDTIVKTIERGRALVQQILLFARKMETVFGPMNLNDVVMEVMAVILETFPKTIQCRQSYDRNIPYIDADRSQIHQVLLNLSLNARDAMPNGGTLILNTKMVSSASIIDKFPNVVESSYACIEVKDTGVGMTEEIRKRIFEPFYTTKEVGKGTGLGLAVVFGIIQSHRGYIDVESKPGEGTVFRIYLPASQVSEPVMKEEKKIMEEISGGNETLLVVEDEQALLEPLEMLLGEKGYEVLAVNDGVEALKIYRKHRKKIALVITDLGLPQISGLQVGREIRQIDPEKDVILATGYLEPEMKEECLKSGINNFIFKPYEVSEVLRMIRKILNAEEKKRT